MALATPRQAPRAPELFRGQRDAEARGDGGDEGAMFPGGAAMPVGQVLGEGPLAVRRRSVQALDGRPVLRLGLEEGQEIVVATARTNIFQMPNR